jgi:hypothetical protein
MQTIQWILKRTNCYIPKERRYYSTSAGRNCPLKYRYPPSEFANKPIALHKEDGSVYVIGGLYGNHFALQSILNMKQKEEEITGRKVHLIFNGDFNWFNVDKHSFQLVNDVVKQHMVLFRCVQNLLT